MDKNCFSTLDFYLAAFLMASNHELTSYYRKNGFTTFIFDENTALTQHIKEYYLEKTLVEPVRHGRAIKNLKSLLHSSFQSTANHKLNNGTNNKLKGTE